MRKIHRRSAARSQAKEPAARRPTPNGPENALPLFLAFGLAGGLLAADMPGTEGENTPDAGDALDPSAEKTGDR
jgi:hypothetical protein